MVETIFLGAIVTGFVQWLKNAFNTSTAGTLALVALLSFILAVGGAVLQHFNLLPAFLAIVASASTIYAFIVQHMEAPSA